MAQQTMTLRSRRRLGIEALLFFALVFWFVNHGLVIHLRPAALFSGTVLLALTLFLTLFNARKKIPFIPLLRAATWTQIHIYAGYLCVILFGLHVGWRIPRGSLEIALAILFIGVALSGMVGIALSRWMPPKLAVYGENVIFERIPALRASVRREAEELVVQSVAATHSSTVADFYEKKLRDYFARPQSFWKHLIGNRKRFFKLLSEVDALDRYLNAREREIMAQLAELIRAKDNLDYQSAGQGALKAWLFVHIPLTYAMLILAIAHGVLAWSFS
jgi:hypothetical protein